MARVVTEDRRPIEAILADQSSRQMMQEVQFKVTSLEGCKR